MAAPHSIFFQQILLNKIKSSWRPSPSTNADKNGRIPGIYFEEVRLYGKQDPLNGCYIMPLVTLNTRPCRWSMQGGCLMCGYFQGSSGMEVTTDDLVRQTDYVRHRLDPVIYPALVFTSNGSFLDPSEVDDAIRPVLLDRLRSFGFRFVIMETRPEFITIDRLEAIDSALSPLKKGGSRKEKNFSLSMGVESSNDFVLSHCINKGQSRQDYLKAFPLLQEQNVPFDCYVLLGKPFMSAQEDVQDAIETIKFCVDQGSGYMFVMVTNLMRYSLTNYLSEKGRYRLPSLWRVIELLTQLPEEYRKYVQVKGYRHAPVTPLAYATTCSECGEYVKNAIDFWNMTGDVRHVTEIADCSCRALFYENEWGMAADGSLEGRVAVAYRLLADEFHVPQGHMEKAEERENVL